jgi:WD40 repeat protein
VSVEVDTASVTRPFIGLRPFDYRDRGFFFGRSESVEAVESLVTRSGFVAVVGSSGTGKSSLIRAGLLPSLETRANDQWRWATMEPGEAPIRRLARAISSLRGPKDDLTEAWNERIEVCLRASKFGIPEAISLFPESVRSRHFLIVVDQFEELFRFANLRSDPSGASIAVAMNRDEATAFVRLLLTANSVASIRAHIVLTMRSDYIGECSHFHDLPEAVTRRQYLVPGLTRDQRAIAITRPVAKAKADIDPELVQRLLNDTNDDPDQLPIIQHVMSRCWQSAVDRAAGGAPIRIDADDYLEMGGVAKALSLHANLIFDEFSREDASEKPLVLRELVAKRVFQALTEVDQDGRVVRRPMKFGELEEYVSSSDWNGEEASAAVLSVVTRLAAPDCSFLRITKIDDLDDHSIVDIGHEALIRRWSKLKGGGETDWIREEQDDGEKYRDLVRIARAHSTIPDAELLGYEAWWARRKPTAAWAKRYSKAGKDCFAQVGEALARSREEYEEGERERAAAAKAEVDAREARLKLAAAEAQMEAARARASVAEERAKASAAEVAVHVQKVRMTRVAAAAAGVLIVAAAWFGMKFYNNREVLRENQKEIALQRQQKQSLVVSAADNILVKQRLIGAADALTILMGPQTNDWSASYFEEVYKALADLRETRRVTDLAASGDGASERPTVFSVSANPKKPFLVVVTAGNPPTMHFLEVRDGGRSVSRLGDLKAPISSRRGGRGSARWSPDGERIYFAGAGTNGAIITPCAVEKLRPHLDQCKDKTDNDLVYLQDPGQRAGNGVWSGDGKDIVTSTFFEGQPSVWNASTGKIDAALENIVVADLRPDKLLSSLAMSASGKFIAEGDSKGAITVLRTDSGEAEPPLEPKQDGLSLMQMYFDPVDDNLLLAIYQSRAVLWNIASGKQQTLDHDHATIMQAAFDPKGQFIITAANDGTVRLFKLSEGVVMQPAQLRGHHGPVFAVDVAPDGTIVSGSGDGSVRFWQAEAVGSPSGNETFETTEVERLKSFVAQNLPYLDYGSDRIALPEQILCSLASACENKLSQAAQ